MAYEALVVIGFGVILAIVSVALFWAHVKRINAPNKVDPEGTVVVIDDLDAAIAADARDENRKLAARGRKRPRHADKSDFIASASSLAPGTAATGPYGAFVENTRGTGEHSTPGMDEKEFVGTKNVEIKSRKSTATVVLPSSRWAEAVVRHADVKRKKLRSMVKNGEVAAGWEGTWERLPSARRHTVLQAVREELQHAVSSYVGRDESLFAAICPELSMSELEEERRGVSGFSRLVRRCLDGKVPEPRSRAFMTVQNTIAKAAAADTAGKDKGGPVRAFLATFRKLCLYSFCIGSLEAVASGRADGTGGPSVSSVCSAIVKTGGSGFLLWVFFHGLQQMTVSDIAAGDAAGSMGSIGSENVGE